jgi:RNA polymerase sigma factor (sigma-70 family)
LDWEDFTSIFGVLVSIHYGIMDINELQNRAIDGDKIAEERLFRNLRDKFALIVQHRISDPEACQDVVQDALTTIADKHSSISFETSFAAWAYRVMENKVLQYYRSAGTERKRHARMDLVEHRMAANDLRPETKRRFLQCLRKVVGVNRRFARVLNLRYQGYSIEEICERMGITRNATYNLLSRGRRMLRECLQERRVDR